MKKSILKAKHWQVFLIVLIAPAFIYLATSSINSPLIQILGTYLYTTLSIIVIMCYLWLVTNSLQKSLPKSKRKLSFRSDILFTIPILLFILLVVLHILKITGGIAIIGDENEAKAVFVSEKMLKTTLPVVLTLITSAFLCVLIVAKTLKSAIMKKEVKFTEYMPELIQFIFFPVGIWILQPKINRLKN